MYKFFILQIIKISFLRDKIYTTTIKAMSYFFINFFILNWYSVSFDFEA
jgi:hypothetical protein